MGRKSLTILTGGATLAFLFLVPSLASAQVSANQERRLALVIGNATCQAGALATTANDAGLIAQTLQAAGLDLVGARDLDQDGPGRALRDFVGRANTSGHNTVAYSYYAGYGIQLEGGNYLMSIDVRIAGDSDVRLEAVRRSECASSRLKATIVVLDPAPTVRLPRRAVRPQAVSVK